MNKTEADMARILQARQSRGEIAFWEFEAVTLHLGGGAKYTPDFLVILPSGAVQFIETKGGHIWDAAVVRFKVASEKWKILGSFEMHQKKKGSWSRIL